VFFFFKFFLVYQSEIVATFPSSSVDVQFDDSTDDSAIINESYTVLVELLKHTLQLENTNDFNQQIQELSSSLKI